MSILTSVESGFDCLYTRQNELDALLSKFSLSLEDNYKIDRLKKEISDILTDILAMQSEDVLSSSFYLQVNEIEQELYNLLEDRNVKLKELVTYKEKLYESAQNMLNTIYSIEALNKCFHINIQSEAYFLDVKNHLKTKALCDKKILALEFLKGKLPLYENGLMSLIVMASKNLLKEELTFEKKQEIFNIFSSISLKSQRVKNHKKVYNEDIQNINDDIYTLEYLEWFEGLFLEMCKYVDLEVESYYEKIKDTLCNKVTNYESVNSMCDYIHNRYKNEIELNLQKVQRVKEKVEKNVRRQLDKCLDYEDDMYFESIYQNLKTSRTLPNFLQNNKNAENYKSLLFDLDIDYSNKIDIKEIFKDIQNSIYELFEEEKYLEMYKYNSSVKSIEVANYRQYYLTLLEQAIESVKKDYIEKIEDTIIDTEFKYNTAVLLKKIKIIEEDIKLIKEALNYINKNYRDFSKTNLKIYIDSIQKRYALKNLYDNILAKKSNLVYKLMAKSRLNEETRLLYEFANKKEIKEKLQNEILSYIFGEEEELKEELIANLK